MRADNTNAILSVEGLTSSFMEKVEDTQSEEQPTTDTVQDPNTAEAADSEEEQEVDVLSQSDTEEEDSVEESDDSYFFRLGKIGRL